MNKHGTYDVLVVGGGINGCGIARDLIGRGYTVALAEKADFASGTSSWSTKLIHGGLRYLEHYEFRLVREALIEREVLMSMAPHIIRPLRFILPHHKGLRPAWMLRLGLFAYDNLGGRKLLPATRTLDLRSDPAGAPLGKDYGKAFEYSDCSVDDARLVILNARDAADRGATIMPRTEVVSARTEGDLWRVTLRGADGESEISARALVNAAGPWVDRVLGSALGRNDAHNVRLVQGSHIVVKKLYDHDRAYIFQNSDGRIIFAIPYEDDFTLIGTTDQDYTGDPQDVKITPEETRYLLDAASEYFAKPVLEENIVWTFSGVRPLFDDGASKAQEATRDYVLRSEGGDGRPALVNVFGGKLTTYRRLAESAAEKLAGLIGAKGEPWTAGAPLPGGNMPVDEAQRFSARLTAMCPWLPEENARRLARLYGTRALAILDGADSLESLGRDFGAGLTAREITYLMDHEWAQTAEDVLWRRTKLGIRLSPDVAEEITAFMQDEKQDSSAIVT
ncbi:glycerol-3-phosphate dehydrogenase [Acuticoccus sp. MNP-M23]|uniref:glycerol-3-phosphate dehydrogenase n=1 Tax=Acuticoccus sp. MNP-M23 TaxID=3072793 RepID=UPI00281694E7|nr:glycerol-3-phosphate dehydrogenase [Acuticoccus sp. MNP-M23]WMS42368.1 glycerol-3-phosphate dehydrogenase [Acuticoccus sp. MNP-M23]